MKSLKKQIVSAEEWAEKALELSKLYEELNDKAATEIEKEEAQDLLDLAKMAIHRARFQIIKVENTLDNAFFKGWKANTLCGISSFTLLLTVGILPAVLVVLVCTTMMYRNTQLYVNVSFVRLTLSYGSILRVMRLRSPNNTEKQLTPLIKQRLETKRTQIENP